MEYVIKKQTLPEPQSCYCVLNSSSARFSRSKAPCITTILLGWSKLLLNVAPLRDLLLVLSFGTVFGTSLYRFGHLCAHQEVERTYALAQMP